MEDWGEIKLLNIDNGWDFWCLFDALCKESSLLYDRTQIVDAYKNGNLYGLKVKETEEMNARSAMMDKIFLNCLYLLPCLCIKEDKKIAFLWIHHSAQNIGIDKKFTELLRINV